MLRVPDAVLTGVREAGRRVPARLGAAVAARLGRPVDPDPGVDPALAGYLNEQLVATSALVAELRRAAADPDLAVERPLLQRLRREVAADRAELRAVMQERSVRTDWVAQSAGWAGGRVSAALPLLHRLPVVDRLPVARPARDGAAAALLRLEQLHVALTRRALAAAGLATALGRPVLPGAQHQADQVAAAHRRCARALFGAGPGGAASRTP
ncbi:hypothetical protein [Kineococcus terrestris]|uniref:hypothetical protein n=1 Tax=Kineococcus terrestris TaxID=2044856 RepID=UPI0034DB58BF